MESDSGEAIPAGARRVVAFLAGQKLKARVAAYAGPRCERRNVAMCPPIRGVRILDANVRITTRNRRSFLIHFNLESNTSQPNLLQSINAAEEFIEMVIRGRTR